MALSISETWESGAGSLGKDGTETYSAIVSGNIDPHGDNADDPTTVTAFAIPHFSWVSALGFILNTFDRERIGVGTWKFTAVYKSPTYDRQTNDASFTFSTGGGTQHITCSRATIAKYGAAGTDASGNPITFVPADYKGAIGVNGDDIAGTDVEVETLDFKLTFYIPPTSFDATYITQLKRLTKRVNSDTVSFVVDGVALSFQPGELRLIDATGQKRVGFGDWELALHFSAINNEVDLTIGTVKHIQKDGWDYLWVAFAPIPDAAAKVLMLAAPRAVYIERVYDRQALSGLIPTIRNGQTNVQPWANPPPVPGGGVS